MARHTRSTSRIAQRGTQREQRRENMRRWHGASGVGRRPGARGATDNSYATGLGPGRAAGQHAREASAERGPAPRNRLERGCPARTRAAASGAAALRVASHLASRSMAARTTPATSRRAALASVRAFPVAAPLGCRCASHVSSASLLCSLPSHRCRSQWPNQDLPPLPTAPEECHHLPCHLPPRILRGGTLANQPCLCAAGDDERAPMPLPRPPARDATHARMWPRMASPRCERHRISPARLRRRDPHQPLPRGRRTPPTGKWLVGVSSLRVGWRDTTPLTA